MITGGLAQFMNSNTAPLNRSDLQAIFDAYESLLATPISDYCYRKKRLKVPLIPIPILESMIKEGIEVFKREPTVLQLTSPVYVIGDLNGHLLDLLRIIQNYGSPKAQKYLFLGNIINNGEFSIETLSLILIMKFLWPANVSIIRGVNEFRENCLNGSFNNDLEIMYETKSLFMPFMHLFAQIPLAATIDKKILCVNGGFGPNITDLSILAAIKRPIHTFNSPILIELMWSDPTDALPMFLPSTRGFGNLYGVEAVTQFLKKIKYKMILRGRQCVDEGCQQMFNDSLISIFSASKYCNQRNNKSGIVFVSNEHTKVIVNEPLGYLTRKDVIFTPSENENTFVLPPQQSFMNASTSSYRLLGPKKSTARLPLQNGFRMSTTKAIETNSHGPHEQGRLLKPIQKPRISSTQRTVSKMVLNL
ncbi:Ser/Thr protein phosphatase [Tritrichomonas foetus]|uniref:protein-serine/threonine phosphatase n=1 Tax=Tritrichomonas foetus TaxID=1144522 RepID=A0A1J4JH99_9EUKA|nr:Ser/Thr protein phosphatase [Tritrichomonas foetus]|eukprot:OHS98522.1 Ser/Thr protein phosphatase [Tritrichomonas foetus]